MNGSSDSSNNTRIDGVSTTNVWLPHVAAYVPALESLETVNVVTNSFDAEQGLAGGSAINVQIKSGTNQLRGSAFEYYTNEQMRELNYFAPANATKGDWAYHQFGATLGGPILRNKLFYFGSYESTRDKQNATRTISVPTAALRRGDLSGSVNPIYDPATGTATGTGRTPFAGNIIPQDRIDPIAAKIISLMPMPNVAGAGETDNYFAAAPFEFNRWTLDTKVNWNATSKLNIFGRYSHLDFWTFNEAVYGDTLQGIPITGRQPRNGSGLHGQLLGGRHLRALAQPRRRRALRLRADVHRRRAHRYRAEQRAVAARDSGSQRPACVRRGHARLRLRHLPGHRDHGAVHAVHPQRRSVSDRRERQLDEGKTQRSRRHRYLFPGAESPAAGNQRRRQLWRARRLPLQERSDADKRRAVGHSV